MEIRASCPLDTHRVQSYIYEVMQAALELGVKVAVYVVVGTNEGGWLQGAIGFHTCSSRRVEVVLVSNNRDESAEFGEDKLSPN